MADFAALGHLKGCSPLQRAATFNLERSREDDYAPHSAVPAFTLLLIFIFSISFPGGRCLLTRHTAAPKAFNSELPKDNSRTSL